MPKKNGTVKTYSFNEKTLHQLKALSDFYSLKPTNVLEFLINKEFREKCSNIVIINNEDKLKQTAEGNCEKKTN